jgi:hypothetical protein
MYLHINYVALSGIAYYPSDEHMTDSTRQNVGAKDRELSCWETMSLNVAVPF